jgi:ubiquitin carboxyl-terminal hydrolase 5/13
MGFTENAAQKAAFATKNASFEQAMEWLMQHMDDPDINEPHPSLQQMNSSGGGTADNQPIPSAEIEQLTGLGFSDHQAQFALRRSRGDVSVAADWLFNHADEVPPPETQG